MSDAFTGRGFTSFIPFPWLLTFFPIPKERIPVPVTSIPFSQAKIRPIPVLVLPLHDTKEKKASFTNSHRTETSHVWSSHVWRTMNADESDKKKEVFPKPKESWHIFIPRTHGTRFFDRKGPCKQVLFRWTPSICIDFVLNLLFNFLIFFL